MLRTSAETAAVKLPLAFGDFISSGTSDASLGSSLTLRETNNIEKNRTHGRCYDNQKI